MSEEEDILSRATQRVGTVLHGKYRLDAILGIGGMAVVYAATHRNQKRFAVKVLHPEFSVRGDFRARFVREGYAANSVAHEGVVGVLDDDVDETGTAFLVMDLLHGADVELLRSRSEGKLALRLALSIAHQVLLVLEAAHGRAIVHRDIKPANFFVLESGQLRVLDFGVAQLREGPSNIQVTRSGAVLGTPAFMAPEQASAQNSRLDARTDLWALGASLFTMLSGQFVHEAENGRQVLIRAATTQARSVLSAAPGLPACVAHLVDRALRFEQAARWESAAAMRQALLEAHQELFGELTLEPLRECLQGLEGPRFRISASVASEFGKGETTAATSVVAAPEAWPEPVAASQKPTARIETAASERGPLRYWSLVAWAAACLLAVVLVRAWSVPIAQPPSALIANAVLAPAQPSAAPASPTTLSASAWIAPEVPPVDPAKAAAPAPPRAALGLPKSALAKLSFNAPQGAKTLNAAEPPAPVATGLAIPPAANNPLELKLQ